MQALLAIIDLEASGFGRGSYPIKVGNVLVPETAHGHSCKQRVLAELPVSRHRASTDACVLRLALQRLRDASRH